MITIFFAAIFSLFFSSHAHQYLYPVAALNTHDASWLYVIHQKAIDQIELWQWNPETKQTVKALLSTFRPMDVRVMPENAGISFMNEGRIRVKKFIKRSPKAIDIYEPLYTLHQLTWITPASAYFCAQENERYGIYHLNVNGSIQRIRTSSKYNCRYPCKIDPFLFYIEHAPDNPLRYSLAQCYFPLIYHDEQPEFNKISLFDTKTKELLGHNQQHDQSHQSIVTDNARTLVLDFSEKNIRGLTMISPTLGFVLACPKVVQDDDKLIHLNVILLKKEFDIWEMNTIFSCSLPKNLIYPRDDIGLFESIAPLLPVYINDTIYFSDLDDEKTITLKGYNVKSNKCEKITQGCFFSPVYCNNKIYYGGQLDEGSSCLSLEINSDGDWEISLPTIKPLSN